MCEGACRSTRGHVNFTKAATCFKGQFQLYRVLQPTNKNLPEEYTPFETQVKPPLPRATLGGARPPARQHRCMPPSSTTLKETQDQTDSGSSYLQQGFASHTPAPRAVRSQAGPPRTRTQRADSAAAILGLFAEHVGNALRPRRQKGRGGRGPSPLEVGDYKVMFGKDANGRLTTHPSFTSNKCTGNMISDVSIVISFLNRKRVLRLCPSDPTPTPKAQVSSSKSVSSAALPARKRSGKHMVAPCCGSSACVAGAHRNVSLGDGSQN